MADIKNPFNPFFPEPKLEHPTAPKILALFTCVKVTNDTLGLIGLVSSPLGFGETSQTNVNAHREV